MKLRPTVYKYDLGTRPGRSWLLFGPDGVAELKTVSLPWSPPEAVVIDGENGSGRPDLPGLHARRPHQRADCASHAPGQHARRHRHRTDPPRRSRRECRVTGPKRYPPDPRFEHIVGRWATFLAFVTGTAARTLCGATAETPPTKPVCPGCAARDPHTAALLAQGHTTG